jgi:hypothetical protein
MRKRMAHGEEGGGDDPQEEEEAEACLGRRKAATAWGEGAGGARGQEERGGRRPVTVGDKEESEAWRRRESKVLVGILLRGFVQKYPHIT